MDVTELLELPQPIAPPAAALPLARVYTLRTAAAAAAAATNSFASHLTDLERLRAAATRAIEQVSRGDGAAATATVREYAHRWYATWAHFSHRRNAVAARTIASLAGATYAWRCRSGVDGFIIYRSACVRFETLMACTTLARMLYNTALVMDAQTVTSPPMPPQSDGGGGGGDQLRAVLLAYQRPLTLVRDVCLRELAAYEHALERGWSSRASYSPVQRIARLCDAAGAPTYPVDVISRPALEALEALCRGKMQIVAMRIGFAHAQDVHVDTAEIAALYWYAYEQFRRALAASGAEAHRVQMARCLVGLLLHTASPLLARDAPAALVLLREADTLVRECMRPHADALRSPEYSAALVQRRAAEIAQRLAEAQRHIRVSAGIVDERLVPPQLYAASEAQRAEALRRYAAPPDAGGCFFVDERTAPLPSYLAADLVPHTAELCRQLTALAP
jgi:hypothetical protein